MPETKRKHEETEETVAPEKLKGKEKSAEEEETEKTILDVDEDYDEEGKFLL